MDMQTRRLSIRNVEKPSADSNESMQENINRLSLNKTGEVSIEKLNLERSSNLKLLPSNTMRLVKDNFDD
jgi:hypothetical protein